MKTFLTLAVIAVFLVLISGCTSQQSSTTGDEYSGDIELPVDDTETINTETGLGSDFAPADEYENSMDNDMLNLQDNSEPDSNMGLGVL
jgi:hypothetical protein